jgi:hypothetical protein
MTTTINADSSNGFKVTADTSSILALQTNGTTAISIDASQAVSFTNSPTVTGGTANGVAYLNGSKVLTTGSALVFDGTNLGVGVTPSAWVSSWRAIQLAGTSGNSGGSIYTNAGGTTGQIGVAQNWYWNGTNNLYLTTAAASDYYQYAGTHVWRNAASGTAGNTVSFTQAMTLDASGNLILNDTSRIGSARLSLAVNASTENMLAFKTTTNGEISALRGLNSSGSEVVALNYDTTNSAMLFRTASAERARIDSSGNLLVGTTNSSGTVGAGFKVLGGRPVTVNADTANTTTVYEAYSTGAAAYRFYVGMGGTVYATITTITAISDQRLKENIRDLDDGLASVMALKPRKFDWKEGKGANIKNARGFIAQEFETVFPDMIDEWRDPAPEGEEPYKAINANLIPTLVKAIQELKAEFDAYKASHP